MLTNAFLKPSTSEPKLKEDVFECESNKLDSNTSDSARSNSTSKPELISSIDKGSEFHLKQIKFSQKFVDEKINLGYSFKLKIGYALDPKLVSPGSTFTCKQTHITPYTGKPVPFIYSKKKRSPRKASPPKRNSRSDH